MKANFLSSPTFRYLGGNFAQTEFEQVNPKPWSELESDDVNELNDAFKDKLVGISTEAINLNKEKSNARKIFNITKDQDLKLIRYEFDSQNNVLLDDIKIQANENTKSSFIIDYKNIENVKTFRNSFLYVYAKENSVVDIFLISRQDSIAKTWQNVGIIQEKNAEVNFYVVDMGIGEKILSHHSYLNGAKAKLNIEGSYFTDKQENFDVLYNVDILGQLTKTDINVNGIQKDDSKKIFRAVLDFKKGAKASEGSQTEYVTLLDKTVRSKSLPIILCGEENITGNHAASAGQIDEDMVFYIMSRGFSREEAKSLIVKARLIPVIDKIPDEQIKQELLEELKLKMLR